MFDKARKDWHKSAMYKFLKAYTHAGVFKKYMPAGKNEAKIFKFIPKGRVFFCLLPLCWLII